TSVKSQNDSLADQVHKLEVSSAELQENITVYDNYGLSFGRKILPYLLNTISGRRWLLTHGLKLFLVKCLNLSEYLTALGSAIIRAIEKRMQSGLAAGIDHGMEGRSLADVTTYNPDAKVDFNTALQELREVDFPLLAELKSYKDVSTKDIMNVLRLEEVSRAFRSVRLRSLPTTETSRSVTFTFRASRSFSRMMLRPFKAFTSSRNFPQLQD
nr:hypothetical protein [Tanacetum cinerariifolium]